MKLVVFRLVLGMALSFSLSLIAAEKGAEPKADTSKPAAKEPARAPVSTNDWHFIDNGTIKVGVNKTSGAGIGWISQSGSERNLVNTFDRGRLIQQSYYGKPDDSMWDKQPWRWNPVQGGDWKGNSAKVLEFKATTNSIYAKTMAKHWAAGTDLPEVTFEEWISVGEGILMSRYRMTYTGKETHPESEQEVPAIFLAPDLDTLVLYDGDKPWTGGQLNRSKPGWPNETRNITERWAAYVDKNDFGIGAYITKATRLTCYRFGEGNTESGACSYFAPVTQFAFTPGKVFEYEVIFKVGTTKEIRDFVYWIRKMTSGGPPAPGAAPKK
jgi:hypothetical protein